MQDAAAEYLPQLEFASGMSVPFIDTLGNSYHFRFRFWQNTSRIFLLEGTQEMQVKCVADHTRAVLLVALPALFSSCPGYAHNAL